MMADVRRLAPSFAVIGVVWAFVPITATASFTSYSSFSDWQGAGGAYLAIGFDEVPDFTFVLDEYTALGASFPSLFEYTHDCGRCNNFPIDGVGLEANWNPVEIIFDSPQSWIGMHHPGDLQVKLYDGDTLVYQSGILGGGGSVFFSGIVGTTTFTRAVIKDPFNGTFAMDNLYFGGPSIPAPGVAAVLLAGSLVGRRRRA